MPTRVLFFAAPSAMVATCLCFVPLFDVLGYESSACIGLVTIITGYLQGFDIAKNKGAPFAICRRALVQCALHLLPCLIILTLNGLRIRNCNYAIGFGFFALLAGCSSLYATLLGVMVRRLLPNFGMRLGASVVLFLGPLCISLWQLYFEPPIFAYNHLWGYFAGSLYDEAVGIQTPLLAFRAVTLLRCVALITVLHFLKRPWRIRTTAILVGGLALMGNGLDAAMGSAFGYRITRSNIEAALPIVVQQQGLRIHLPPGTPKAMQRAVLNDHGFRLAQVRSRLGLPPTPTRIIHSYVYKNANEKSRLMGGRNTMFAKPWLGEIHIHGVQAEHAVVAHELVHAVAAEFAPSLLGVTSRYGIWVNMAVVEGLAEALTPPRGALDLDSNAKALGVMHIAPDIRAAMDPRRFWSQAPRRVYTTMGSLMRFLLHQYGPVPLQHAYAKGDFATAFGQPLEYLIAQWKNHIDAIELPPKDIQKARTHFKKTSIFKRPCAHVIAQLRQQAQRVDAHTAVPIYREICGHLGNSTTAQIDLALAIKRTGDFNDFLAKSQQMLNNDDNNNAPLTGTQRAQLYANRGEVFWQQNALTMAKDSFQKALQNTQDPNRKRLQWVRLWSLEQTNTIRRPMATFLSRPLPPRRAIELLQGVIKSKPGDKTLAYLLGRQWMHTGNWAEASKQFIVAAVHPFLPIEVERIRLLGVIGVRAQQWAQARRYTATYGRVAQSLGERARAKDWLLRIDYLEQQAQNAINQPVHPKPLGSRTTETL